MPTVKARVIPKPEEGTRTVLVASETLTGPFMKGHGPTTYICGLCGNVLIESIYHGQIRSIVFKCMHAFVHGQHIVIE